MEVYLNRIDGLDDAVISMYFSKRHMNRAEENRIRGIFERYQTSDFDGVIARGAFCEEGGEAGDMLDKLFKWGVHHPTLLRFIDLSFTVYGLHRAGQDDLDSHAKRMDNRIIRESTRLGDFKSGEMSDWYKGNVLQTDSVLDFLHITMPDKIVVDGNTYVRAVGGYILAGHENDRDYKRGLYSLCIPSSFIFRCNLTEFSHIYKERREGGNANPEVKMAVEMMTDLLEYNSNGRINRDLLMAIPN